MIDVGVDVKKWNYAPVNVLTIIEEMKTKPFERNRMASELEACE